MALSSGVGAMTWSPLACGIISGKYDGRVPPYSRASLKVDTPGLLVYPTLCWYHCFPIGHRLFVCLFVDRVFVSFRCTPHICVFSVPC